MNTINFPRADQNILIKRKPNPRAKRLSLRMSTKDGSFVLSIPPRTRDAHVQLFLNQCSQWIENQLRKTSHANPFTPGEKILLHGESFQCVHDPLRRKPVLCKATQTLRLPLRYSQKSLHDFLKSLAQEKLTQYVSKALQTLGQDIEKLTFRDGKSRWGSCSARKTISLNWRLVMAPPEVAEYVCIHEVAHLLHMNHSKDFWQVVSNLCPTYKSHKKWLKIHGVSLMRI